MDPKTPENQKWWREGLCNDGYGTLNGLFFPDESISPEMLKAAQKAARQICNRCPVKQDCLDWAISTDEKGGIWGGKNEDQRRNIKEGTVRKLTRHGKKKAQT